MTEEYVAKLWLKIDQLHLRYLETVEEAAKLRIRSDLECKVAEYLSIVPHDRRFVTKSTGDLITNTIKWSPNLSPAKIAGALCAVEEYAAKLIREPSRKELWRIDQRSAFYAETIGGGLVGADKLFQDMGFRGTSGPFLELSGSRVNHKPVDISAVTTVARDCLLASVECSLIAETLTGVTEDGLSRCSLLDIDKFRRQNVGLVNQAIRDIVFKKRCNQELEELKGDQEELVQDTIVENQEKEKKMAKENRKRLEKVKKENRERMKQLKKENEDSLAALQDLNQEQLTALTEKHAEEKAREKETTPTRNCPEVPECPICFDEMVPPVRIFQCRDGHLVCETCKAGLEPCICPECRQEVTGRAIGVEKLLRSLRLD